MNLLTRTRPGGCSPIAMFVMIVVMIAGLFIGDMAYIFIGEECMDLDPLECALAIMTSEDNEKPEGSVTAVGSLSGDKGSLNFTLNIPLKGGAVTGSFDGDCDGTLKATFAGGNGGAITGGIGKGSCGFVLPASGNFTGTVNTTSKTATITGKGSIPGGSKEGSVTLKWSSAN